MPPLKPYRSIPIRESGEPLVELSGADFAFFAPHPYVALGAPYGVDSPWMLRESLVDFLRKAQENLQKIKAGWKILMFDAYRPNAVQAFMVARELTMLAQAEGLNPQALTSSDHERLMNKVFRVFAIPSEDPATPPPHSTGAAFDCTLSDETGREVDMGSPIDENSDRSFPDYFKEVEDPAGQSAHANRVLLHKILSAEGFWRNPGEWWHFSRGDQLAVWLARDVQPQRFAMYGRV